MNKDKKMLFGIGIAFLFLATVGLSYAYFTASITNKDVKDQVVQTGTLELAYTDGPQIVMNNIKPGAIITKEVSVKNTGTLDTAYNLVWQELTNKITHNEMVISATCERLNDNNQVDGTCGGLDEKAINLKIIKRNISIESGITHKYIITITFKDTNTSQNYNQGKTFNGVIGIEEYKDNSPEPIYCTYDGELTQGAEYTNGQYTYSYKKGWAKNGPFTYNYGWVAFSDEIDGWGVTLTDKTSTDPVTSKLCTYINDKPIVVMDNVFLNSQTESIDLSSFNTSNVISMASMFDGSIIKTIVLSSFNTSKVTNMRGMFASSKLTSLDLSNFDTSKVNDMSNMFYNSEATSLDVSNFDTSNVNNMSQMFDESNVGELDVSKFDTSKVTNMANMFGSTQILSLDLSNFDTSNVTNMAGMFSKIKVSVLNLSNFDTTNVISMNSMFSGSSATSIVGLNKFNTSKVTGMGSMFRNTTFEVLDLSSFNTSNVFDMDYMFYGSTNLTTIYVGDKFVNDNVTRSTKMFTSLTKLIGGAGTTYDENHIDKEYARIDGGTDLPGYFTLKTN